MNNVSIKNFLIGYFITGFLIIPIFLILIKMQNYGMAVTAMLIWPSFFWGNVIAHFNNADISINETNDIITLRTIFNERKILLKELRIIDHVPIPTRSAFIFYTNSKKIIVDYTLNNYKTVIKILNLIKYKNIDKFIADAKKRFLIYNYDEV